MLLLNAALTVRAHEANSHSKKGWEDVTTAAIQALSKHCDLLLTQPFRSKLINIPINALKCSCKSSIVSADPRTPLTDEEKLVFVQLCIGY